jgi:type IX secretion system PorP/SprF family membrane protein
LGLYKLLIKKSLERVFTRSNRFFNNYIMKINKHFMKRVLFLFAITMTMFSTSSYGQQDPQYTHYMYNMNVVNPAYAGSRETLSIGLLGRTQWVGIDGAPQTLTANIHAPIGRNLGLGLSVIVDEIGPVQEQNVFADVSYTIRTSEEGQLAFGLKGGVSFFNGDLASLLTPNGTTGEDPLLNADLNETFPNIGAGVYYYTQKFYLGLSVPNILETEHFDNLDIAKASEKMHGFLSAGYVFELTDNVDFKPATIVKVAQGAPVSVDITGNFLINDRFELGLAYRFDDSIDGLVSFLVTDDFRIGYSYDYTLTDLQQFNSGSHEVFLQYDVNLSRRNLKSPRFF